MYFNGIDYIPLTTVLIISILSVNVFMHSTPCRHVCNIFAQCQAYACMYVHVCMHMYVCLLGLFLSAPTIRLL